MKFQLKKVKPVTLTSSTLVKTEFFNQDKLPLVIKPNFDGVDLIDWIRQQKQFIDEELTKYGAILFRGFDIKNETLFNYAVSAYDSDLLEYKERSTPRTALGKNIYTATEYPADQKIPLHNENSYSPNYPLKLWFCCVKSSATGGQTPLADSRKIYDHMSGRTRDEFIKSKVKYTRNYGVGIDLDWKTVFQTDSKKDVENYCRTAGIDFKWISNEKLHTEQIRPAVIEHPLTKEKVWFNQAHLFHYTNLPPELRKDLLETTDKNSLSRNAYFGDGSEIPEETLDEIRKIYDQFTVSFYWQEGDLLIVDNLLAAHGRNSYTGDRKILVAMSGTNSAD